MLRILLMHVPAILRSAGPCLAMIALYLAATAPVARAGGMYDVAECSPGHAGTPDATVQGSTTDYSASTSCATGNWLQTQSVANTSAGNRKQWSYSAPAGTQIERFKADYNLIGDANPDGNRSYFFVRRQGQSDLENLSVVGLGSTSGTYDSTVQPLGPLASIGAGIFCSKTAGTCNHAPGQIARLSGITFRIEDLTPPAAPVVVGSAADGAWVSGSTSVIVGDVDVGGGVARTTIEVNGTQVANDAICNPGQDGNGYVSSMTPCDQIELRPIVVATGAAPFQDGTGNSVKVCTHEFGAGAASTCTTKTFRVDNVAPAAPQSVDVAGGTGWHRDNDFDVSWTNPAQMHAPIAAAAVTVNGPGGYSETTTYSGQDIDSVEGIEVPQVGAYTADVSLRDAAGNILPANKATVPLKFDDTVPVKSEPEIANGWISHDELAGGYRQDWRRPTEQEVPPSGIAGYGVAISSSSSTDPCEGGSDNRACGHPLTEVGINNTRRDLTPDDLVEGTNFVHVVPVSGSGMRASVVGRTPLKVDLTDPVTEIAGPGFGWTNHPVNLEVAASDPLSGMVDTDEYPDDVPPRTVLAIDGDVLEESDGDVATTLGAEGVHHIEYWARDLAGNENDGQGDHASPGEATVKIDVTAPAVAFTNAQDTEDPDRLEATFHDGLSGVEGGAIEFRREDRPSWTALETEVRGDRLVARVDSNDLEPGIRYEFRARAVDAAGNWATSMQRQDGTAMAVVGPFRRAASITGLAVNGKKRARIGFGKAATITGRLADASGSPIASGRIELTENFLPGAEVGQKTITAVTDGSGGFRARLHFGPSRTVQASYAGDLKRLGAASPAVSLRAKGKVSLRATKSVRAGGKAKFSGRVSAPGARFTRQGKSVEVQVRVGKKWKTVGRSLRTDRHGRYKLRYRFVADYSRPVRYRFRTVVLRERGWPYLPSISHMRSVLVRP